MGGHRWLAGRFQNGCGGSWETVGEGVILASKNFFCQLDGDDIMS